MIKIAHIYRSTNGSSEPFELNYEAAEFAIPEIEGHVKANGLFMRVEEGVMMLIEKLEAKQKGICSRCAKSMDFPLNFSPSEWLFYEGEAHEDDKENEWLKLDTHRLELDPMEPIRQDLLLNLETVPRCKKLCKKFEESKPEPEKGLKSLAGLKDLHLS